MDNKINTDNATNTIVNDSQKRIDLHVHSDASDGTLSPESLVKYAYQAGLSAFALTDHDTVMGIPAAMSTGLPIKVIPGIELSAGYKNRDIHILGLFIDYKSKLLTEISQNALTERNQRNQKMINNLRNAGIPITMEDLYSHSEKNGAITRAHFARFLVDHGSAVDKNDAFAKYLSEDTPYYVKREYLTPEQCIQIIHECGGYSVLAHPILYNLPENELAIYDTIEEKTACTKIKKIAQGIFCGKEISLAKIQIETGRKHQIRIHCASRGFPLLGDKLYGGTKIPNGEFSSCGFFLHAWKLEFPKDNPLLLPSEIQAEISPLFKKFIENFLKIPTAEFII